MGCGVQRVVTLQKSSSRSVRTGGGEFSVSTDQAHESQGSSGNRQALEGRKHGGRRDSFVFVS